jgi:hypothetical protein
MGDAITLKLQAVLDSRSTSCPRSWSATCFCGNAVTATPAALVI